MKKARGDVPGVSSANGKLTFHRSGLWSNFWVARGSGGTVEQLFGFRTAQWLMQPLVGRGARIVMVLLLDDLAVFDAKCVEDI